MRHRARRARVALQRVGRPGRPARKHREHPGRAPLRRRGLPLARPPPAGPAASSGSGPVVRVVASDSRSQHRNRELALERLRDRLAAALRVERPRVPTRVSRSAKEKRLQDKRRRVRAQAHPGPPGGGVGGTVETVRDVALFVAGHRARRDRARLRAAHVRAAAWRGRAPHPDRQRRRCAGSSICACTGRKTYEARDRVDGALRADRDVRPRDPLDRDGPRRLHDDLRRGRGRRLEGSVHPERLVDVHARLRAADRLLGRDARLRRGGDRARACSPC